MPKSKQLITDLDTFASASFTRASIEKANTKLRGQRLSNLVGAGVARAAELKTVLMEIERVLDRADPQLARVESILSVLN